MSSTQSASPFGRLALRLALLSSTMFAAAAIPFAAQAQTASPAGAQAARAGQVQFNVPPQELDSALTSVADQGGIRIFFTSAELRGVRSNGASGAMSVEQALSQVLTGSGFGWRYREAGTVVVERLPKVSDGAIQLGPVRVEGEGAGQAGAYVPPQAEIGNLPPAYAGGQVARGGKLGVLGNRDMMDTPFNQTSYTAALIQNQQVQRISEVLSNDPTVRTLNSASSGVDDFSIRGFNVSNMDVLFNGLAGVAPSFSNAMMAESIERVEVLKGPSAFLNGASPSGGVGGSINVVPKRATNSPVTQLTLGYSSDAEFGGHIDVGRRFGDQAEFGVRFNGVYRDGDTAIDNQSRRSALAAFGLDYQGERLRLSADLGYQDQRLEGVRTGLLAFTETVPKAPRNRNNFSNPSDFYDSEVFYGTLRAEYDLSETVTLFAAAGGNKRSQLLWTPRFGARFIINDQGDLLAGNRELAADRMKAYTLETGIAAEFHTGALLHQVTLSHTRLDRKWRRGFGVSGSPIIASNIYSTYEDDPAVSLPALGPIRSLSDLRLNSTALVDTLSFMDDRVMLTVGARHQTIDATSYNNSTGVRTNGYDENKLTPMAGLVVKASDRLSLYANYIEGLQQGAQAPQNVANAGEVFAPYVTRQYEIGGKVDFGQFAATLAFYQVAQPSAFIDPATNIFGIDGEQRHRGVDFNVFGEIASGVRLLGGVAYIDSKLTKTLGGVNEGNRGIAAPEWNAVLGAEWDVPFAAGLTLTARVTHTGPQFLDTANAQRLPGWSRVDAGARYRIDLANGKAVTLRANIQNLFDKSYWQTISGALDSIGEPRTISLSASIDF